MNKYNYGEVTRDLIDKVGLPVDEIFYYEYCSISKHYEDFFQFCQKNLSTESDDLEITPALFFFRENLSINAGAKFKNGFNIIYINKATLFTLYDFFSSTEVISVLLNKEQFRILNDLEVSLDTLLFQLTNIFTFYHERCHLYQKPHQNGIGIDEQYFLGESSYSFIHHVYECDADIAAAKYVSAHTIQIHEELSENRGQEELLESLLTLSLIGIFMYTLHLMGTSKIDFYYRKTKHPHPIIRSMYISIVLIDTINKKKKMDLKFGKILNEALAIVDDICQRKNMKPAGTSFLDTLSKEKENIYKYFEEIMIEGEKHSNLFFNFHP